MALAVTSNLTLLDACDSGTWVGTGSPGIDSDFKKEGSGSIAVDTDIETNRFYSPVFTAIDMSSVTCYAYMMSLTAIFLDTKANGGMQMGLRDSSGNESYWFIGGNDTYSGGWELFSFSTEVTPDGNNGANATLTDITNVAFGWKGLTKSRLSKNCFGDFFRYLATGSAAIKITGTNAVANVGWDEVAILDDAVPVGIVQKVKEGLFVLKGPIAIGDASGSLTTAFTDKNSILLWDDMPVDSTQYGITVDGNGTGTTDVTIGSVVGSGDDRQGVQGGSISTAGPDWSWDSKTDITDIDTVKIYGVTWTGARRRIEYDDFNKTSIISSIFINCGQIDPGVINDGAEMLSCFIIDPDDAAAADNWGLLLAQTLHKIKKMSFVTSGTPSTQNMTHFTQASDYTVTFDAFKFFGTYTGSLFHGENDGLNADITISATNGSTPIEGKFQSTNSGTLVVSNDKTLLVHVEDNSGVAIQFAQVYLQKSSPTKFTSGAGNNAGDADLVVTQTIDFDMPQTGWCNVLDRSIFLTFPYRYVSHDGVNTFSFASEITFACTGGGTSTGLEDSVNDFTALNIVEGDTIRNVTDGSFCVVDEVTDLDNILTSPLQGGTLNLWTSGDFYSVHRLATTLVSTDEIDVPLMNGETDSNGDISKTYNYSSPVDIKLSISRNTGTPKYVPLESDSDTITGDFTKNVVLEEDPYAI